jgi:predicted transposase YbfD/YdcC
MEDKEKKMVENCKKIYSLLRENEELYDDIDRKFSDKEVLNWMDEIVIDVEYFYYLFNNKMDKIDNDDGYVLNSISGKGLND